ncbi:uncharacterized protein LACBIDRAFT_300105 [Laccaria bicolor S238N-H82]|uniref:Predicted protein n=1 Tax=Laccaria bicolor (strain S238N-H82 / ATCC MYA-4686) TaxID=486041 RepID=B0DG16_LACBS|nr:uncharacterized protein LACBIDRAFT_300105 [Laccaria bicolor S238N-H82]EDR06436.1 predicted protein [Laccaria bicolor S238N-H82]|eukprot:XP_001882808.1 predicted protein [Laccaria bicolor S238N-H82]
MPRGLAESLSKEGEHRLCRMLRGMAVPEDEFKTQWLLYANVSALQDFPALAPRRQGRPPPLLPLSASRKRILFAPPSIDVPLRCDASSWSTSSWPLMRNHRQI